MTPLGKSLVFYLKYMAEMNRLCRDEEPDWKGLELAIPGDGHTVRTMVRTVEAAATEQAAEFAERCEKVVDEHFECLGIATISHKRQRAYVQRQWTSNVEYCVMNSYVSCGVWITAPPEVHVKMEKDACGVLVPWIWSKGGRKAADAVWNVIGGWAHSRRGEGLVSENGTVALACIPITVNSPESFDADSDLLIAEVRNTFSRIGVKQAKAIAKALAGLA